MFDKVQQIINGSRKHKKYYEKLNDGAPLRSMLTCAQCGSKLTSSASKGRNSYYHYYHCRGGCKERIPVEKAHKALLSYFDEVAVAPEVADLYLEVMDTVFKANEANTEREISKLKETLVASEKSRPTWRRNL